MMRYMVSEAEKKRAGTLIRHRRQALGLDQPGLARLIGVSRQTVSKWETGQSYPSRYAGKVEAVLAPFSLSAPGSRLDFDPADRDEATIASWTVFTAEERQQKIYELRAARRIAQSKTA
jgi:transcriptional regulator with XRE-family HTH domain